MVRLHRLPGKKKIKMGERKQRTGELTTSKLDFKGSVAVSHARKFRLLQLKRSSVWLMNVRKDAADQLRFTTESHRLESMAERKEIIK